MHAYIHTYIYIYSMKYYEVEVVCFYMIKMRSIETL